MTVFQHLLDTAVTNGFTVHKELSKAQQQKAMTRQAFQEEVSAHLLGVPLNGPPRPPTQSHFPIPTNKNECTDKTALRRKRALCATKEHFGCVMCVMWVSVFRWTRVVLETTTAKIKKSLAIDKYISL